MPRVHHTCSLSQFSNANVHMHLYTYTGVHNGCDGCACMACVAWRGKLLEVSTKQQGRPICPVKQQSVVHSS